MPLALDSVVSVSISIPPSDPLPAPYLFYSLLHEEQDKKTSLALKQ